MIQPIQITKASGEKAPFNPEKLRRSLHRAGAGKDRSEAIVRAVAVQLREGMTTREIYRLAHRMLRKETRPVAARYSLKQALLGLGPSGYPFERFVGKLLEADGYKVQTGLLREGHCVPHEIDVLAELDGKVIVAECKFHNRQHLVSDVKIPLYIHSRFRDLQAGFLSGPEWQNRQIEGWIFTNTRFTEDALQYGRCSGLQLVAWNTPFDFGLADWIDRTGLHPLSCLSSLTQREKDRLLNHHIVLVREILDAPEVLAPLRLAPDRQRAVLQEAESIAALRPA
ncbi:MAG: restriction endonuclease [Saprospiraceae bacterium]|nr:restriction endonuclease [Saprospiraceae bacterium]